MNICDQYMQWRKGQFKPNKRQLALLMAWEAFLDEHPSNFDEMVHAIPDHLTALSKIAERPAQ